MKTLVLSYCLLFFSCFGTAQTNQTQFHSNLEREAFGEKNTLKIFLASDSNIDQAKYNAYQEDLSELIKKLKKYSQRHDDLKTLEKIFYYTHKTKLANYTKYVTLSDLFERGEYDCLTGTALYGLLLDEFNIQYDIYEFAHHVMILAYVGNDSVLIESTDPFFGFETKHKFVKERLERFTPSEDSNVLKETVVSQYGHNINNKISLTQLAGLQYFNLAIAAYNDSDFIKAELMLEKAHLLYPSNRSQEIFVIFNQTIAQLD